MSGKLHSRFLIIAAASAALVSTGLAADTPGFTTISLSGSTAMANFTRSNAITNLVNGASITINGTTYTNTSGSNIQLAPSGEIVPTVGAGNAGYRIEWHEQGSVEGIFELLDSQVNDNLLNNTTYNATNTWVNRNQAAGGSRSAPFALSPFADGFTTGRGVSVAQMNRVQMAISDVAAPQGFSKAGTSSYTATPGTGGYGKGNSALGSATTALPANTLLTTQKRFALQDESAANLDAGTFGSGAWNNAGVNNLESKKVAISATLFVANPGTGLERLNRSDAQFMQATGRLGNGADFNVATRDVGSGTRNVASLNVGLDTTFAVGENDDGNSNGSGGFVTNQTTIGSDIRFSNKLSGGSHLRPTVQNSRMGFGHLGISDYKNAGGAADDGSRPLRALDYNNALTDGSGTFYGPNARNIIEGNYALFQNQSYVTVKANDANYATANPNILGDVGGTVLSFRNYVLGQAASTPNISGSPAEGLLASSFILPAMMIKQKSVDGGVLTNNPDFDAKLAYAGASNTGTINAPAPDSLLGSTLADAFKPLAATPAGVTKGSALSRYGNDTNNSIVITDNNYLFGDFNNDGKRDFQDLKNARLSQQALAAASLGGVAWNQNSGSGIIVTNATAVPGTPTALSSMLGQNGSTNAPTITGATKGDLIVKGDFDADGDFDGKDLYYLARGTSLADAGLTLTGASDPDTAQLTSTTASNVADRYRAGKLYKNAALDYMQANTTDQQKDDARVVPTLTGRGNAFNKFDVNRDGVVNKSDALIVHEFIGSNYTNLQNQLDAVIKLDGTPLNEAAHTSLQGRKSISLVDVELTDDGLIDFNNDFLLIGMTGGNNGGSVLLPADANLDDFVDVGDFAIWAQNVGSPEQAFDKLSRGDFNGDHFIDVADFGIWAQYVGTAFNAATLAPYVGEARAQELVALVPEPASLASLAIAGLMTLRRRRRGL